MKQYILISLLSIVFFACQKSEEYEYPETPSSSTLIESITLFDGKGIVSKLSEIDSEKNTIVVTVDSTVDITKLAPRVVVPDGTTINPAMGVYVDFSLPKTYTVTSGDKTSLRDWVVSVEYSLEKKKTKN